MAVLESISTEYRKKAIEKHEKDKLLCKKGNYKIGKDTIILNMGFATHCPSAARGLCKIVNKCYALKAEKMYKAVLPYRERQADQWRRLPVCVYIEKLKRMIEKSKKGKHPIKYVRFNESGDFYDQSCVLKLDLIARALKGLAKVYTYTARRDLRIAGVCDNLNIVTSGFDLFGFTRFLPVKKASGSRPLCPADCTVCGMCKSRYNLRANQSMIIEVIIH